MQSTTNSSALLDENRLELGQAKVRCWVVFVASLYETARLLGYSLGLGVIPEQLAAFFLAYYLQYGLFSIAIWRHIKHHPGHYPWRRILPIITDNGSIAAIMFFGGPSAAIFYAVLLWVTLGNGMRFGPRYLVIAGGFAQICLLIVFTFNPFWSSQTEIYLTFAITALAIPIYGLILLRQTAQARDAALLAMQAKGRFLAQASHDLRQPIHAIGYHIDALRETRITKAQTQVVDRIERSLGSVARLFKSLLDISKLDSGTVEVRAEAFPLQPFFDEILLQNEQALIWQNVELRIVPTTVSIRADPTLLATMVQNLISNAIKYGKGGRVLVGVRHRGETVAIEVHDRGVGIAENDLPNIFDEFYRAHIAGDHDQEGVGLGLAIVRRLASLSGFSVAIDSVRGRGTTARLSGIPVSADQIMRSVTLISEAPRPLAGMRIILIDDDVDTLDATAQMLIRWGCEVQASTALPDHSTEADLIIADFDLGAGQTGTMAISALRDRAGRTLPAILISGHAETRIKEDFNGLGIQLLAKPLPPAVMRSTLSAIRLKLRQQS